MAFGIVHSTMYVGRKVLGLRHGNCDCTARYRGCLTSSGSVNILLSLVRLSVETIRRL